VLFDVDDQQHAVVIHVVGEKRGNRLFVQGKEYVLDENN
jgi:hypothetical protein